MNKGNDRIMAIIAALRKLPRWALVSITVGVIIILGVAMFLLLPQASPSAENTNYLNSTGFAFSVFLKLGVVVLIIAGLAIVIRKMQIKGQVTNIKLINVLETVHLTPHRTLYLVNVADQKLLIGATDQSLNTLFQFTKIDEVSSDSQEVDSSQSFSDLLDKVKNSSDD